MITPNAQGADNGDAKSPLPSGPPPTYAQVAAAGRNPAQPPPSQPPNHTPALAPAPASSQPHAPSSQPEPRANSFGQPPPSSPPPRTYGPTPLANSQGAGQITTPILPYYDPRSQWALREATSRARRRFFGALFWGCLIWIAVGSLIGTGVDDMGRRARHGSWAEQ